MLALIFLLITQPALADVQLTADLDRDGLLDEIRVQEDPAAGTEDALLLEVRMGNGKIISNTTIVHKGNLESPWGIELKAVSEGVRLIEAKDWGSSNWEKEYLLAYEGDRLWVKRYAFNWVYVERSGFCTFDFPTSPGKGFELGANTNFEHYSRECVQRY